MHRSLPHPRIKKTPKGGRKMEMTSAQHLGWVGMGGVGGGEVMRKVGGGVVAAAAFLEDRTAAVRVLDSRKLFVCVVQTACCCLCFQAGLTVLSGLKHRCIAPASAPGVCARRCFVPRCGHKARCMLLPLDFQLHRALQTSLNAVFTAYRQVSMLDAAARMNEEQEHGTSVTS